VQEKLDAVGAWDLDSRIEMAMDALRCPPGNLLLKFYRAEKEEEWRFADYC
jgi:hypothetical protein